MIDNVIALVAAIVTGSVVVILISLGIIWYCSFHRQALKEDRARIAMLEQEMYGVRACRKPCKGRSKAKNCGCEQLPGIHLKAMDAAHLSSHVAATPVTLLPRFDFE